MKISIEYMGFCGHQLTAQKNNVSAAFVKRAVRLFAKKFHHWNVEKKSNDNGFTLCAGCDPVLKDGFVRLIVEA